VPVTGKADPRMACFDDLLVGFIRERKIPGAAVAISRRGRLVHARGYGFADVEKQISVAPDALFRIASISKPVTAVAVLQLVEQGRFGLDDKLLDRLPIEPFLAPGSELDPRTRSITVRQLLQHTAGWDRDVAFDPMFRSVEIARELDVFPPARPPHIMRYMFGRQLDFAPGERYAYSNIGYSILGRLIEKYSGDSYDGYVKSHVLGPLGIHRMQLGKTLADGRAPGEVKYYETSGETTSAVVGEKIGALVPWPYGGWCLEAMDSHGGWIASAVDLVRFAKAFDEPERCPILGAPTIAAMFARPDGPPGLDGDGKPKDVYYGLGWFVRPSGAGGGPTQWHTGSLDGTSTILVRRADGVVWAVLFNTRNGPKNKDTGKEEVPSRMIDPLMHKAIDSVLEWPDGDQFPEFE
jgi:N-acyl-D-amino-acid deacylase